VKLLCLFRRSRNNKAGPALTTRVTVKRKLRDNQRAASYVEESPIHFSLVVFKDPQVCDLLGHADSHGGCIVAPDAKQNHKTRRTFSRNASMLHYASTAHTLDNSSQFS